MTDQRELAYQRVSRKANHIKTSMKIYQIIEIQSPFHNPTFGCIPTPVFTVEWDNPSAAEDLVALHSDEDKHYSFCETNTPMENHYTAQSVAEMGLGY